MLFCLNRNLESFSKYNYLVYLCRSPGQTYRLDGSFQVRSSICLVYRVKGRWGGNGEDRRGTRLEGEGVGLSYFKKRLFRYLADILVLWGTLNVFFFACEIEPQVWIDRVATHQDNDNRPPFLCCI